MLPYIDLVNEILENAVLERDPRAHQSAGEADDLRVLPEHREPAAYAILANRHGDPLDPRGIYPWSLPFDLHLEASRLYLQHLGLCSKLF